ncbi:unnamed protein product [Linum tenue]|uniref:Uncharacterized protein n=1 Tax=Linum tenue TaxID=586396 RepID=A0AAV0INL1_9ROSI|nr:unnamed protein product [Linum tenue]
MPFWLKRECQRNMQAELRFIKPSSAMIVRRKELHASTGFITNARIVGHTTPGSCNACSLV